jgi:hypothetical protein
MTAIPGTMEMAAAMDVAVIMAVAMVNMEMVAAIIAPVMAAVPGTAGTAAAIIALLMTKVPGTGARSTGIFALAVEINNNGVRPDNFIKSALSGL